MSTILEKTRDLFHKNAEKLDLPYILAEANPNSSFSDRLEWMDLLMTWLRSPIQAQESTSVQSPPPIIRLKFLLQLLERHPEWKAAVAAVWASFFVRTRGLSLFAYAGLLEGKGLIDQITDLVLERILPISKEEDDLTGLMLRLFDEKEDAAWVREIPDSMLQDIRAMIEQASPQGSAVWDLLLQDMIEGLHILAIQIAAVGTSPALWTRLGASSPSNLAFMHLQRSISLLAADLTGTKRLKDLSPETFEDIKIHIEGSQKALEEVIGYLQQSGVNMGLIFRLQNQTLLLQRVRLICDTLQTLAQGEGLSELRLMLSELIESLKGYHDISSLFRDNLSLLALRVVEHAGSSGEHYISRNRREYWQMLRSAAGGGVLTVGTTVLKFGIVRLKAPAFIEALLHWLNYSSSFLLMQGLHFTLATKQPSMTASSLAKKLSQGKGADKGVGLAAEIRLIMRSQLVAAVGNVGIAIPSGFLLAWLVMQIQGQPLFPADFALYSVESLHPFHSLTLLFAVLTGILLWMSSLIAGWVENWAAFQKIPERLRDNRHIRRAFGDESGGRCAEFMKRNISGIAANISLGFLLGMMPFMGRILGLPLEVRHVTLSAAQLAIAMYSGAGQIPWTAQAWACLGIVLTGMLNFGVSFWLALAVAGRAQHVRKTVKRAVMRQFFFLFRTQPLSFFIPTRKSEEDPPSVYV